MDVELAQLETELAILEEETLQKFAGLVEDKMIDSERLSGGCVDEEKFEEAFEDTVEHHDTTTTVAVNQEAVLDAETLAAIEEQIYDENDNGLLYPTPSSTAVIDNGNAAGDEEKPSEFDDASLMSDVDASYSITTVSQEASSSILSLTSNEAGGGNNRRQQQLATRRLRSINRRSVGLNARMSRSLESISVSDHYLEVVNEYNDLLSRVMAQQESYRSRSRNGGEKEATKTFASASVQCDEADVGVGGDEPTSRRGNKIHFKDCSEMNRDVGYFVQRVPASDLLLTENGETIFLDGGSASTGEPRWISSDRNTVNVLEFEFDDDDNNNRDENNKTPTGMATVESCASDVTIKGDDDGNATTTPRRSLVECSLHHKSSDCSPVQAFMHYVYGEERCPFVREDGDNDEEDEDGGGQVDAAVVMLSGKASRGSVMLVQTGDELLPPQVSVEELTSCSACTDRDQDLTYVTTESDTSIYSAPDVLENRSKSGSLHQDESRTSFKFRFPLKVQMFAGAFRSGGSPTKGDFAERKESCPELVNVDLNSKVPTTAHSVDALEPPASISGKDDSSGRHKHGGRSQHPRSHRSRRLKKFFCFSVQ